MASWRGQGKNYTVYLYNNKYVAARHGPVLTDVFRVNSLRNGVIAVSCKSSFSELAFSLRLYLLPMQPRAFVTESLYSSMFFELKFI
jgi:hypothetical protein